MAGDAAPAPRPARTRPALATREMSADERLASLQEWFAYWWDGASEAERDWFTARMYYLMAELAELWKTGRGPGRAQEADTGEGDREAPP